MIHELKTEPKYFKALAAGTKEFDVRKDDRKYRIGDYAALNEWSDKGYTGRCTLHKIVHILSDPEYCREGYVVLVLKPCAIRTWDEMEKFVACDRGAAYER